MPASLTPRIRFAHVTTVVGLIALFAVALPRLQPTAARAAGDVTLGSVTHTSMSYVGRVNLRGLTSASPYGGLVKPLTPPNLLPTAADDQGAAAARAAVTNPNAPLVGSVSSTSPGKVVQNVNGLDITDTGNANTPWVNEPPDQALCASASGALESVNVAVETFDTNGNITKSPVGLWQFFLDQYTGEGESLSDPRCYFDTTTHTWFFLVLGFVEGEGSHVDLAVNPSPDPLGTWTIYRMDTTDPTHSGCPCLADQPLLGTDNNGVYISTNEFSWANDISGVGQIFNGAQIYAIDKAALISNATTPTALLVPGSPLVNVVKYQDLSNGGMITYSMEPAMTRGSSGTEYFLDALDPNNTTDTRVGVWALTNTASLPSGGTPTLSGVVTTTEKYGFPPDGLQKNIAGESYTLAADDDRMLQVTNYNGTLYSSLNTLLRPSKDTVNRTGAAWFAITPHLGTGSVPSIASATVLRQGYVAVAGAYLLYPAVTLNGWGDQAMVMTITSATMYPSVAVATGTSFNFLGFAAKGTDREDGFSCSATGANPCRWGDYSAATASPEIDAQGRQPYIWLATEYIPSAQYGDTTGDWGTRVIKLSP